MSRLFPILRHPDIALPWSLIAPHAAQAKRNHDQTLERLAERGGLSCCEAAAVLEDRDWRKIVWPEGSTRTDDPARDYLMRLIAQRTAAVGSNKEGSRVKTKPMTRWMPDDNPHQARRIGKTAEEVNELGTVLARISIQGIDAIDPSSGKTNRQRLLDETADVIAQCDCNLWSLFSEEERKYVHERALEKRRQMAEWEAHYKAAVDVGSSNAEAGHA